jgi:DNA-binding response OmpR family regulator
MNQIKKKVLLVDDEIENLQYLERMLKSKYDVFTALDGAEGVAIAILEKPDLVVMDVQMPIMDGFDACSKIKTNDETKHAIVLIVSGMEAYDKRERALNAGACEFIDKPFKLRDLIAKINEKLA